MSEMTLDTVPTTARSRKARRKRKISAHARRLQSKRAKPPVSPKPIWSNWVEPRTFAEALDLHMRRHGESSDELWRAIIRDEDKLEPSTIAVWRRGVKAPRSAKSFVYLSRVEERYGLSPGYFRRLLPHPARATAFPAFKTIEASEQRRLAWHLPNDFASRPAARATRNPGLGSARRRLRRDRVSTLSGERDEASLRDQVSERRRPDQR